MNNTTRFAATPAARSTAGLPMAGLLITSLVASSCSGGGSGSAPTAAQSLDYAEPGFVYRTGVVAPTLAPTDAPSGSVTFSVSPALPAGLILDPANGSITGEPTATAAPTVHTVTATGDAGTFSDTLELEVRDTFGIPRFAYALDWDGARIQTWRVDAETGSLLPGGSAVSDSFPFRATSDPLGRFLYVSHFGTGTLGTYRIDQNDGSLTLLQLLPVGTASFELEMSPTGRFLVAADVGTDTIATHAIDPDTGLLAPSASSVSFPSPSGLTLNVNGDRLFAASIGSNLVASYALDRSSGTFLGQLDVETTPGPVGVALAADEATLFTANSGVDAVTSFSVDLASGDLVRITSVFSGEEPVAISVDQDGSRLAVANLGGRRIEAFTIESDSSLTLVDSIDLAGTAVNLVELPFEQALLVPLFEEGLISSTRLDETNSSLVPGPLQLAQGRPSDVALVRTATEATLAPEHVYVANRGTGDVAPLVWNGSTTQLLSNGAPIGTGGAPVDVELTATGERLMVAEEAGEALVLLDRDDATGQLSAATTLPSSGPLTAAVPAGAESNGVLTLGADGLVHLELDVDGNLVQQSSVSVPADAADLVVTPDGHFAYVANRIGGNISGFSIDGPSLTELSGSPFDDGGATSARAMAISPDGQLLVASNAALDRVRVFRIDRASGALTLLEDLFVGDDPRGLAWSLEGTKLYVALHGDNAVAIVDRDLADDLTLRGSLVAGQGPIELDLDPSGERLYVAAGVSNTLEALNVAADGSLTLGDSYPLGAGAEPRSVDARGRWVDLD